MGPIKLCVKRKLKAVYKKLYEIIMIYMHIIVSVK